MLKKRRYDDPLTIIVDGHAVLPSQEIRYLGVRLNVNRSFTTHVEEAAKRAEAASLAVALVKRKMLMAEAISRLLYAAPIWASGPSMTEKTRGVLARVNRLTALRLSRAYRTVSGDAATFLTCFIPLDFLTSERAQRWAIRTDRLSAEDTIRHTEEIRTRTLSL